MVTFGGFTTSSDLFDIQIVMQYIVNINKKIKAALMVFNCFYISVQQVPQIILTHARTVPKRGTAMPEKNRSVSGNNMKSFFL